MQVCGAVEPAQLEIGSDILSDIIWDQVTSLWMLSDIRVVIVKSLGEASDITLGAK